MFSYLICDVFTSQINQACKDRGVFFTYVDLRWGISEDQTKKGETISICLQEVTNLSLLKSSKLCRISLALAMFLQIDRCPYFICLLGERFGWSLQENEMDEALMKSYDIAIQKFPENVGWIDKCRVGFSVTNVSDVTGTTRLRMTSHVIALFSCDVAGSTTCSLEQPRRNT